MLRQAAFTLIEVLAALLLAAILAGAAIPAWQGFLVRQNDKRLQSQVVRLLEFSREAARLASVDVFFSLDRETISVADSKTLMRREVIHLNGGRLFVRSYPKYRDVIRFTSSGADNAMLVYCHKAMDDPVWAVALSQVGLLSMILPDSHGNRYDSRKRE